MTWPMIRGFFILMFFVPMIAYGQSVDPDKLDDLAAQQKQAEAEAGLLSQQQAAVKKQIDILNRDLVAASAESRGFERSETKARARLTELEKEERALTSAIMADRQSLSDMLAALQRLSRQPPPALLVSAQNAVDAARAANLLGYVAQEYQERADALVKQLDSLQILRADISQTRAKTADYARAIETRLTQIKSTISDKSRLSSKLDKGRQTQIDKAKTYADEAQSLRELIEKLEENTSEILPRIKPPPSKTNPDPRLKPGKQTQAVAAFIAPNSLRFADARSDLPLPVFGKLARKFGARLPGGSKSKGISLRTSRRAQVIAPFNGRVEFSGLFNDDHVVILNVGNGYFIVLSGLGETFSQAGTRVDAGEPLGLMPTRSAKSPLLFVEFRKNRASIDPMPWIGPALARTGG